MRTNNPFDNTIDFNCREDLLKILDEIKAGITDGGFIRGSIQVVIAKGNNTVSVIQGEWSEDQQQGSGKTTTLSINPALHPETTSVDLYTKFTKASKLNWVAVGDPVTDIESNDD